MVCDHVIGAAAGAARAWVPPQDTERHAEFDRIAWLAGQDLGALALGRAQKDHLLVPDFESHARLLRHAGTKTRALRQLMLPRLSYRARLWQGVHDRGEAACFAAGPLAEDDARKMRPHFPAPLVVHSIPKLRLRAGDMLDLTSLPEEWELGDREEIYVLCNIDRLEIDPGAEIRVAGNPLSLVVQEFVCHGGRIEIGPTPNPVDRGPMGGFDGANGANGMPGADGEAGQPIHAQPSVLGPIPLHIPAAEVRDGTRGSDGTAGTDGARGRPGGLCKTAEILIRRWSGGGLLEVTARAGDGGDGGAGGSGGDGGAGGAPGAGHPHLTPPIADGAPGRGAAGGRGGNGGAAGHAGLGSHVFVETPRPDRVTVSVHPGLPGRPGAAGRGGRGGAPGLQDQPDLGGATGADGRAGREGRMRPGPEIFVIDISQGAKP